MPRSAVVFRLTDSTVGGWVELNSAFAGQLTTLGLDSAAGFLELPGEVVCGHPDRHVARVVLPCGAFYLKRQHVVDWRERLRNRLAGFGWVSRCEREAELLKQLAAEGLPAPRWAAFGGDGRGRAFLLVEEVRGAADLREVLSDATLSQDDRRALAERLGGLIARLHDAGFTTPDLTAKHVLVSEDLAEITLIDWQCARRTTVSVADQVRALAALHASVSDELATPRERLRLLRAALGSVPGLERHSPTPPGGSSARPRNSAADGPSATSGNPLRSRDLCGSPVRRSAPCRTSPRCGPNPPSPHRSTGANPARSASAFPTVGKVS